MATVGTLTVEQKVSIIEAPVTSEIIQEEIDEQATDQWMVVSLIPSGDNLIILFTRTVTAA